MSLQSNVTARIPAHRLAELTNRDTNAATTTDGTILGLACTDVTAAFGTYTGAAYDDTVAGDVAVAVEGVVARLRSWASNDDVAWNAWVTKAERYGKTTGRNRINWQTSSQLVPTTDDPDGTGDVKPAFDDTTFDGYRPDRP